MARELEKSNLKVACQQILETDGSVYSVQWLELPSSLAAQLTPALLLERYFQFIRRSTCELIRPTVNPERVDFRLLSTAVALLSFSPPRYSVTEDAEEVSLAISGGYLVQAAECGSGIFTLRMERGGETVRVTVQLADFCPLLLGSRKPSLLRKLLYRFTQAYIHKVVTVRYLAALYRELTGVKLRPVVKKVQVREGIET